MVEENKSGKIAPEHSAEPSNECDGIQTKEEYNQDLKERLEEKHKGILIKFKELNKIAPDFAKWLKNTVRYGNVDSQVLIFKLIDESRDNYFRCYLYTNDNRYSIIGYPSIEKKTKGYLGCIASRRKSEVGEDWTRGSDLHDGKYSKDTFNGIIEDIVSFELKSLQLWR